MDIEYWNLPRDFVARYEGTITARLLDGNDLIRIHLVPTLDIFSFDADVSAITEVHMVTLNSTKIVTDHLDRWWGHSYETKYIVFPASSGDWMILDREFGSRFDEFSDDAYNKYMSYQSLINSYGRREFTTREMMEYMRAIDPRDILSEPLDYRLR